MSIKQLFEVCIVVMVATAVVLNLTPSLTSYAQSSAEQSSTQRSEAAADEYLMPVEKDPHEFMEYVFQPTYRSLKAAMADSRDAETKDDASWESIQSGSLILAEDGNLLLLRGPQEQRAKWIEHATTVRRIGGELYRAAKEKKANKSQQLYRTLLDNCNSCHEQFAGGKPQLKP